MLRSRPTSRHLGRLARTGLLGVALLGGAAGCGRFNRGEEDGAQRTDIMFVNQSLEQADVFAVVAGGESYRVGTVLPGRTERLTLPTPVASRAGSVNIVARLLGRQTSPSTGPVSFSSGELLQITLPMDARNLTVLPGRP